MTGEVNAPDSSGPALVKSTSNQNYKKKKKLGERGRRGDANFSDVVICRTGGPFNERPGFHASLHAGQ